MPSIPFANNFLAGSIISLVMPALVLIAFAIWYVLTALRISGRRARHVVEDLDRAVNPDPATPGASEASPPTGGP